MKPEYYDILDIPEDADQDQIKKAYRELSQYYHPDKKTGDRAQFERIKLAYETLIDSEKRKFYDI